MMPGVSAAIQRRWRIVAIRVRLLPFAGALGIGAMAGGTVLLKQSATIVDNALVEPAIDRDAVQANQGQD